MSEAARLNERLTIVKQLRGGGFIMKITYGKEPLILDFQIDIQASQF